MWLQDVIFAIIISFITITSLFLFSIILLQDINALWDLPMIFHTFMSFAPFYLTFLFMIRYGHYPIKLMILKSYYIQKATMHILNRLDMILWKRTGKDGFVTHLVMKYRLPIQIIFYIPLIILMFV